jgi:hypothetical protein
MTIRPRSPKDAYVLGYEEAYDGMSAGVWPMWPADINQAYDEGYAAGRKASDDIAKATDLETRD